MTAENQVKEVNRKDKRKISIAHKFFNIILKITHIIQFQLDQPLIYIRLVGLSEKDQILINYL